MWYFLVIFNTKIIKSTKIMITHIIVVIIVTWFCITRKNVVFDVQKKLYNLPELGGGGGRGNLGNARKKSIFLMWGLPSDIQKNLRILGNKFTFTQMYKIF